MFILLILAKGTNECACASWRGVSVRARGERVQENNHARLTPVNGTDFRKTRCNIAYYHFVSPLVLLVP